MFYWTAYYNLDKYETKGVSKYMGVCITNKYKTARRIDIRFMPYESRFTALAYFTGSDNLNKEMRAVALKKNMKLNEYGLYYYNKSSKVLGERIEITSEKKIFEILDMDYLEPHERN